MKVPGIPRASAPGPTPLGKQVSRRKIRYLAQSVALEETGNPLLAKLVIGTVGVVVVTFMIWAAVTRIDEIAVTVGKVVPTGQVQVVQHLNGGVVAEILVREGDAVSEGTLLIRLDASSLEMELQEMRLREMALRLQAQRLYAFATQQEPAFPDVGPDYENLVMDQHSVYRAQVQARTEAAHVLQSRIQQKQNEVELLSKQETTLATKVTLLREEFALRKRLTERGLSSKVSFLEIRRTLNQAEGDLAQIALKNQLTRHALEESQVNLRELVAQLSSQAMTEMSAVRAEHAQVQEALKRLESRVEGTQITAKVAGIVQSLGVHSPGGVVAPRAVLLEIVPLDRELVVEARVSGRDIGHVKANQPVNVKLTAYDFARYGGVSGWLRQISPSTFLDERGEPYYKAVIVLDKAYVGSDAFSRPILPGMTVQANIMTGNKTIMEYLLKPIYTSVQQALQER